MKYFVVSDIHSHYDVLIHSLNKKGYNQDNHNHHLIVLGDLFDRGHQTIEVLKYLYRLTKEEKCTIILGNHDVFLLELLEEKYETTYFNIRHNGTGETLKHLSMLEPTYDNLKEIREVIEREYPFLYDWISSFKEYYELGDYIFVHGGIDGSNPLWKETTTRKQFTWGKEYDLPKVEGKTVVSGHTRVATLRSKVKDYELLFLHSRELFDILYLDGKIMIDRYVEVSKEINVLVLEF